MSYRQEAPALPPCPRCNLGLFAGKVGHLEALGCGGCGGLWLDNAGTATILRRYDVDAAKLASLLDGKAVKAGAVSPFAEANGLCPICAQALRAVEHEGVRLDFCVQHGTFFDRGELSQILDRYRPVTAALPAAAAATVEEVQTTVRHEAAWQRDPLTTALLDWATGGDDWVNRWRRG